MTFTRGGSSSAPQTSNLSADTTVDTNDDGVVNSGIIGKVLARSVILVQKNGIEVDLNGTYDNIVFYEDIYSTNISGSLTINDFVGGLEKFYITGGEKLKIVIVKSTNGEVIIDRSDLVVYRVTSGEVTEHFNTRYQLLFVSQQYITGMKKKLFQSYVDIQMNRVARALFGSMEPAHDLATHSSLDLNLEIPFVCPGVNPIDAIKRFANRMTYWGEGRYYTLFERVTPATQKTGGGLYTGYKSLFIPIESLKVKGDDAYKVIYAPRTQGLSAIVDPLSDGVIRASQLVRLDNFNHIDNMLTGLYNSRILTLNHLEKKDPIIIVNRYRNKRLNEPIEKEKEYSPFAIINDIGNPFSKYGKNEFPGERVVAYSKNDINQKTDWMPQQLLGFMLNTLYRIQVVIDGSTNKLSAGDSVYFRVPSKSRKHRSDSNIVLDDEMMSGYYLATSVKHTITNVGVYSKRVELGRGSLQIDLDEKFSVNHPLTTQTQSTYTSTTPPGVATSNNQTTNTSSATMPGVLDTVNKTYDGLPLFGAAVIPPAAGNNSRTSTVVQNQISENASSAAADLVLTQYNISER